MKPRVAAAATLLLLAAILVAPYLAPYDPAVQHRETAFQPPSRQFILGTDQYGRDQFSRLIYGGRLSILCGVAATALSLATALALGGCAGMRGGFIDELLMRAADIFLALPWLYLLLAVRAALPLSLSPEAVFLLLTCVIGGLGWPRPARLIRGVVLSVKEREYVYTARGFGASEWYLFRRHIFPEIVSVLVTQGGVLLPQLVLAEVTLSFVGLGVGEPAASWGTMLASLRDLQVLTTCWWMTAPAVALLLFLQLWNLFQLPLVPAMRSSRASAKSVS